MKRITRKCAMVVLLIFATVSIILGAAHAKEIKMQESSYMHIMVTEPFEAMRERDIAEKPEAMSKHMALLKERYNLSGKTTPNAKMSGGKPLPVGPTAKLSSSISWEGLGSMPPEEIKQKGAFPYPPLPHVKHATGGMVVAPMQLKTHPELVRFDVDFDLPEAYLPEFPPPLFLISRPDLGDVSGGEEITINNYYEKFNGILTPFQLEGMRLLVTPVAQQQFNVTADRKADIAQDAVSCFSCHTNGHTSGVFHLNPDNRPQDTRFRIDTVSLRGVNIQHFFGSKRSLRSLEDFSEVEAKTAYFDGDQVIALKKGARRFTREEIAAMAAMQNMIAFPPATKLDIQGHLNPKKATESELRGEKIFTMACASCHPAPYYTDNLAHDLQVERFYDGRAEGMIKTFALRGIKDSPPYMHDGRCLTLEDTVEFFNIIQELKLSAQQKTDLVAFMRTL
ncbi:MAG: cytochrome B6 [Candidatus Scalindua sp.]|nr:cytochrome B6 [Candidatus Scalindua sp.]MCR4345154.1 cytochrome B6 [Candidatus Scalindua sp.]